MVYQVGNTGTQYIIPTPLLKDFVGIDKLKVTLPEGELETCSTPALDFVTKCQPTPFNLQLLRGALKSMIKDNPDLQHLPGDDWRPTHTRYLRREELQERLGAYVELSVKWAKSIIEFDAAQLILDTDERHRIEYSLELLMQCINNRLDEILCHPYKGQHVKEKRKETSLHPTKNEPQSSHLQLYRGCT